MKFRTKNLIVGELILLCTLIVGGDGIFLTGKISIANSNQNYDSFSPKKQENRERIKKGNTISINEKTFFVPWSQWQENSSIQTGISDLGAMQVLGIELLNTQNPDHQPIRWFSQDLQVSTNLINPYRYLNLTEFAQHQGWKFDIQGDTLKIIAPVARVNNLRTADKSWGKRIVVDLEQPTVWQISQTPKEGVIILEGQSHSALLERFAPPPEEQEINNLEDDEKDVQADNELIPEPPEFPESVVPILEQNEQRTKIHLNYPQGYGLRGFTLTNPHRLVIDVRADSLVERDILWTKGLRWRQQFVEIETHCKEEVESSPQNCSELFPVVFLEVDLSSSPLRFQPLWNSSGTMTGTSSLLSMARGWEAIAGVNGGFFNRNNQLPLGTLRRNFRWFSGPILNRGAIAWNNEGDIHIGQLTLQETLTLDQGQQFPILFLNSGYVQRGLARYTPEWGQRYTPLTDDETLFIVRNHQVIEQVSGGIAGENSVAIPPDGYLLTSRAKAVSPEQITVGSHIHLNSQTSPSEFSRYPHIVAAGPVLLRRGKIVLDGEQEKFSPAFNRQAASRSAMGITDSGKLIIAAVHHRPQGKGPTLAELAQIMQQLGLRDALNLDGGSSTSLYLGGQLIDRSPVTAARVHNGIGIFFKNPSF